MKLGERIRQLRAEQNLTQPELAEKAGIEQSYLSKLENGKGVPSFDIINRIAESFEMTGMELVNSLEHSYIEQSLSHLPEVAAEYASVRAKKEIQLKKRFVIAAILMVMGLGLFTAGQTELFFKNSIWVYQSDGVILPGEHILQFDQGRLSDVGETREENEARLIANRDRIDTVIIELHKDKGGFFLENVEGGQRYYSLVSPGHNLRSENAALKVLGGMAMLAGLFYLGFVIIFGIFRKQ